MTANPSRYTHTPIPGVPAKHMLPEGCALVLEGGGTRGFYSAGVFEAFMDAGIMFPYIVGVSAGAANALTYIAGQKGRNRQIVEHYVSSWRYVGYRNLLRHRSLFGMDYIFGTIPTRHLFWDRAAFDKNHIRFLTGATDCLTGETVWFEKQDIDVDSGLVATRASCSVPFVSPIISHNGMSLLDGGISSPIPIEKSMADGNRFHVIVLTRNQGYRKQPFKRRGLLRAAYRDYPGLVDAMLRRHEVYNRELDMCEQLEREGKALIIRPLEPLSVGRSERDAQKLLKLYDEGHLEGAEAIKGLHFTKEQMHHEGIVD